MKKILVVQTTFSKRAEAVEMARKAVQKRLAACAQLSQGVESFYWWKDSIEQSTEYILSLKTTADLYPDLETFIRGTHSYETPEIIATATEYVEHSYLQWLEDETQPEK